MGEAIEPLDLAALGQPGRLLRVEVDPATSDPQGVRALVLTFDTGRVRAAPDGDGGIRIERIDEAAEAGLRGADEDDPWWKLLGTGIWNGQAELDAEGHRVRILLQFREDDQNPRIVILEPRDGHLRVRDRARDS